MAKRNEHVLAIMLEPTRVGQEFIEWPLHITIMPWFPCDDARKLDFLLSKIAHKHAKFPVEVGGTEGFGPKKDVKVNLIEDNPKLTKLHWDVLKTLEKNNFGVHQKDFIGEGYRPHITHQLHGRAYTGNKFQVKSFILVQQLRLKKTGVMVKSIAKEYELSGG